MFSLSCLLYVLEKHIFLSILFSCFVLSCAALSLTQLYIFTGEILNVVRHYTAGLLYLV